MKKRIPILRCVPILFFLSAVLLSGVLFMSAAAQETEEQKFSDLIRELKNEGTIPPVPGSFISFGDYEDELAQSGFFDEIPLMEGDHYVFRARVSFSSAVERPDLQFGGCGLFFNAAEGSADYLLVSLRMDGYVYWTGARKYTNLNYGTYRYASPANEGGGELTVIADGDKFTVFLNGEQIWQKDGFPRMGSMAGLALLSGSYRDFGTRCRFSDISVYQWEE